MQNIFILPPSDRWGHEVVAVIELRDATVTDEAVLASCRVHLAGYKMPKALVRRPVVQRSPSGKADYRWALAQVMYPETPSGS